VFLWQEETLLYQSAVRRAYDFARQHTKIKVRAITQIKRIVVVIVSISSPLTMIHFRHRGDESTQICGPTRASNVGMIERK